MSRRMIFLMGAPSSQSLRWDEDELLNTPIYPFYGSDIGEQICPALPDTQPIKWRLLKGAESTEMFGETSNTGLNGEARFFTTQDLVTPIGISIAPENSELSQFYNHSFAVHETSEISAPEGPPRDSMLDSGKWTESTETSIGSHGDGEGTEAPGLPIHGEIADLHDIPSAAHLLSIVPQTMTVNLIVAIVAIRPPRRIVTRQWKKELDLVEVVVADETKSGFGVTFWLPSTDHKDGSYTSDQAGEELRQSLTLIRPRDMVLLRMVGLSCFRERVYGQSLRKGLTKIDLLHRQQVDATDTGGIYTLRDILNHKAKTDDLPLAKVRKVREWIRRFVDSVPDRAGGDTRQTVTLPPDTPEDGL